MNKNQTLSFYSKNASQTAKSYETADLSVFLEDTYDFIKENKSEPLNLLEIGPGSCRDAAWFVKKGITWTGIEGSKEMIDQALQFHHELKTRLSLHVLPEPIPFKDAAFNACYAAAVLMHFPVHSGVKILKDICRILKAGGRFVFSVPLNRPDLNEQGFDEKNRFFLILSLPGWESLVTEAGFKLIKSSVGNDSLAREGIQWLILFCKKR